MRLPKYQFDLSLVTDSRIKQKKSRNIKSVKKGNITIVLSLDLSHLTIES